MKQAKDWLSIVMVFGYHCRGCMASSGVPLQWSRTSLDGDEGGGVGAALALATEEASFVSEVPKAEASGNEATKEQQLFLLLWGVNDKKTLLEQRSKSPLDLGEFLEANVFKPITKFARARADQQIEKLDKAEKEAGEKARIMLPDSIGDLTAAWSAVMKEIAPPNLPAGIDVDKEVNTRCEEFCRTRLAEATGNNVALRVALFGLLYVKSGPWKATLKETLKQKNEEASYSTPAQTLGACATATSIPEGEKRTVEGEQGATKQEAQPPSPRVAPSQEQAPEGAALESFLAQAYRWMKRPVEMVWDKLAKEARSQNTGESVPGAEQYFASAYDPRSVSQSAGLLEQPGQDGGSRVLVSRRNANK
ncbi:unnamed protein product [Amoebophrya sp. A25]|nr:unnamed protein product [Amoebophrya sp. A25]|eukprot:GSA25T00003271001.1